MQIQFKSRSAARAFGKAVDNGNTAPRRWAVNVNAKARQVITTESKAFNGNGTAVNVLVRRKGVL